MAKHAGVIEREGSKQISRIRRSRTKHRRKGNGHGLSSKEVRRVFAKRKRELLRQVRLCDRAMAATEVLN